MTQQTRLLAALLILALAAPLTAQITFQRTYGGTDRDAGYSVAQTTDGGYIITGYTRSFGAGFADVWLIKTDADGDTIWTRTYGGTDDDIGWSVAQTADGGYIIAGFTISYGAGFADVWLIKTDSAGDTMWTRTFGGANQDQGYSVAQTAGGGYIIVGWTEYFVGGPEDVYLVKTDVHGDTMWTRTFGGEDGDRGESVARTADAGYIITGCTRSFGAGASDVWLIKTNASGDTIWTRTYGGTDSDCGYSVAQTIDGGYVIAGYTISYGAGYADVWLIKTDSAGDTMWTRTFGGPHVDYGYSVAQTTDGGYVIAGYTYSFGAGGWDAWLIKTDADGDTIWTRTFGGANEDRGFSVAQTADGSYVITAFTASFGAGLDDVYLIKTDSAGRVAIAEPEPSVAHKPAGATIARAVLYVPESAIRHSTLALLNCTGRKVMDLQPGENDIRHISPGVYFVREASNVEREASSVRKVVVTH
jgi:hypothetical protein